MFSIEIAFAYTICKQKMFSWIKQEMLKSGLYMWLQQRPWSFITDMVKQEKSWIYKKWSKWNNNNNNNNRVCFTKEWKL